VILSCQAYPWTQELGSDLKPHFGTILDALQAAGVEAFETMDTSPAGVAALAKQAQGRPISFPTAYTNARLHDDDADRHVDRVLQEADGLRSLGTTQLVCNPEPIRWGGTEEKTDAQLERQVTSLARLGRALQTQGITLAYHVHDAEMRQQGRELLRMLEGVDEAILKFCLDAHWIYRGLGNDAERTYALIERFAPRTVSVHLRQSEENVWSETFGEGDLDHRRILGLLSASGFDGPLTLEQARESGTLSTMTMAERVRASAEYARRLGLAA